MYQNRSRGGRPSSWGSRVRGSDNFSASRRAFRCGLPLNEFGHDRAVCAQARTEQTSAKLVAGCQQTSSCATWIWPSQASRGQVASALLTCSPFVRLFHGDPSVFFWEDDLAQAHHISQWQDPLMPMLFSLGQHAALQAVSDRLRDGDGEKMLAFLDEVFVVTNPDRIVEANSILQEELWRHARKGCTTGRRGSATEQVSVQFGARSWMWPPEPPTPMPRCRGEAMRQIWRNRGSLCWAPPWAGIAEDRRQTHPTLADNPDGSRSPVRLAAPVVLWKSREPHTTSGQCALI